LAHENQHIYNLRAEKIATVASLSGSIKEAEKIASELTGKIERKCEMRDVEVIEYPNKPRMGLKTIVRADTSEELRIAVMTLEEQQADIDFGDKEQ
jgi:hypothetical protein